MRENLNITQTPDGKIEIEEIKELEKPIKEIILQLKDRIENGEFGIIIGDDASGRIPALILGGFIQRICKEKKVANQTEIHIPEIIFIPGKLWVPNEQLAQELLYNHLTKHNLKTGDKVLIVTDTIVTGSSLKVLSVLLRQLGFEVKIAAVGIEPEEEWQQKKEKNLPDVEIINGHYYKEYTEGYQEKMSKHTPLVFHSRISGVYGAGGQSVTKTLEYRSNIKDLIRDSRKEVNILVDKLLAWYHSLS